MKPWLLPLTFLAMSLSFADSTWAKEFNNPEKGYKFQYNDSKMTLVAPGMLSTDLVLHLIAGENGFYPNLTLISKPVPSGFKLAQEIATVRTQATSLLQDVVWVTQKPVVFKGFSGAVLEARYTRENYYLFMRTILIQTPQLLITVTITSPIATKDTHLAEFTSIVNTLEIRP